MMRLFLLLLRVGLISAALPASAQTPGANSTVDLTTTLVDVNTNLGIGGHSTTTGPGGTVVVTFQVNNLGSPASGAGNVAFYASTTPSLTQSSIFLVYANLFDPVPALGSTQNIVSNVTLPSRMAAGAYYIIVVADYDRKIDETNYDNNPSNGLPITVSAAR